MNSIAFATETELSGFVDTIATQVDHASDSNANTGNLMAPANAENARSVTFEADSSFLPPQIQDIASLAIGTQVEVQVKYSYGRLVSALSFNIRPEGTDGDPSTHLSTWITRLGNEPQIRHSNGLDEQDLRQLMSRTFEDCEGYESAASELDLESAFALGILLKQDRPNVRVELHESGHKTASTKVGLNGFSLHAVHKREHNTTDTDGEATETAGVHLTRLFEPTDYSDGIYHGALNQELVVVRRGDEIEHSERGSTVQFFDDPREAQVNGRSSLMAWSSEAVPNALPDDLRRRLYSDGIIRKTDIDYFLHLSTQALTEADTSF